MRGDALAAQRVWREPMTDEGDPVISTSQAYTDSDVGDFFDQTLQTDLSFWDAEGQTYRVLGARKPTHDAL